MIQQKQKRACESIIFPISIYKPLLVLFTRILQNEIMATRHQTRVLAQAHDRQVNIQVMLFLLGEWVPSLSICSVDNVVRILEKRSYRQATTTDPIFS